MKIEGNILNRLLPAQIVYLIYDLVYKILEFYLEVNLPFKGPVVGMSTFMLLQSFLAVEQLRTIIYCAFEKHCLFRCMVCKVDMFWIPGFMF